MTEQQVDEPQRKHRIADVLPLTPLQRGLLFQASFVEGRGDDVYAVQLGITLTGDLDAHRLRDAVHAVVERHPNVAAIFSEEFGEPVQIIPAEPVIAWQCDLAGGADIDHRLDSGAPRNGPPSATSQASRRSGPRSSARRATGIGSS